MAIRTTPPLVAEIIEVDEDISLDPFITTASALVDDVASADTNGDLTSDRLELIERWLSAHFYAMRDPRFVFERAGPVSATYQSKIDLNLALTHYGQQAMVLDTTGALRALSSGKRAARASWLGTDDD